MAKIENYKKLLNDIRTIAELEPQNVSGYAMTFELIANIIKEFRKIDNIK